MPRFGRDNPDVAISGWPGVTPSKHLFRKDAHSKPGAPSEGEAKTRYSTNKGWKSLSCIIVLVYHLERGLVAMVPLCPLSEFSIILEGPCIIL